MGPPLPFGMAIPQRVSFVTLGARDLASLRAFYAKWGWSETDSSTDDWAAFDVGGWLLALYPIDLLGSEAAPGAPTPDTAWNGVTLAINVESQRNLHTMFDAAIAAGGRPIAPVSHRDWGGMSGYIADPEGNRWELAVGSEFV